MEFQAKAKGGQGYLIRLSGMSQQLTKDRS
jgi:hypothetical protein